MVNRASRGLWFQGGRCQIPDELTALCGHEFSARLRVSISLASLHCSTYAFLSVLCRLCGDFHVLTMGCFTQKLRTCCYILVFFVAVQSLCV